MEQAGNVILISGDDPEIYQANLEAQKTFKYFWREMHWEKRRIIPGLSMAAVKFPFSDGDAAPADSNEPAVEHMWVMDVDFDGTTITGTLNNAPRWLKTVHEGDSVALPIGLLEDWMYVVGDRVYGGHTVSVTRKRMSPRELKEHDSAWGLDFGLPGSVRLVYFGKEAPKQEEKKGLLGKLLGKKDSPPVIEEETPDAEHPASLAVVPAMKQALEKDPKQIHQADDRGWTLLHYESLGGSAATVELLLKMGADPLAKGNHGETPIDLARCLGWARVEELLHSNCRN